MWYNSNCQEGYTEWQKKSAVSVVGTPKRQKGGPHEVLQRHVVVQRPVLRHPPRRSGERLAEAQH